MRVVALACLEIVPENGIGHSGYLKAKPETVGATVEECVFYGQGTLEPERAQQITEALVAAANRLTCTPWEGRC